MEEHSKIPAHILPIAYQKIIELASAKGIKDIMVRMGVFNSGMLGVDYKVSFDRIREGDLVYELPDFKVLIQKEDFIYLVGYELDYKELAGKNAFVFRKKA